MSTLIPNILATNAPIPMREEVEDSSVSDEEIQVFENAENGEINIDIVAEVENFRNMIESFEETNANGGASLVELLYDKLPLVNRKLGRTKMLHIIRNQCAKLLPPKYPNRLGTLRKTQVNFTVLKDAANNVLGSSAENFRSVKKSLLRVIDEALSEMDPTRGDKNRNSEINRMALLAWLLCYPPAVDWWEKLGAAIPESRRPAYIEQPGGPVGYKLACYSELVKLSEKMKNEEDGIDDAELDATKIGVGPAEACSKINPRAGVFKDGGQLKDLHTSLMSRYAELKGKVFSSGFSKDANCVETYERAFSRCGDGKTKDMGVFYVFAVVARREEDIKWLVRDFAATIGESSDSRDQGVNNSSSINKRREGGLSKKELAKETERFQLLATTLGIGPVKKRNLTEVYDADSPATAAEQDEDDKASATKLRKLILLEKKIDILTKIRDGVNFHLSSDDVKQIVEDGLYATLKQTSDII